MREKTVRPARLPSVYLLVSWRDASRYAFNYGGNGVVKVRFSRDEIESKWKASYAPHGCLRLKKGVCATVVKQIKLKKPDKNIPKPATLTFGAGKVAFKPTCIAVRIDGRKAGGSNPRRRQCAIFGGGKQPKWFMDRDDIRRLRQYLDSVDKWIADGPGER